MIDSWVDLPVWDWIDGANSSASVYRCSPVAVSMVELEDIDRLLCSTGLRSPFFALSNSDAGVLPFEFWRFHSRATCTADSASILREVLTSGTTLIIKHAHRLFPKVAAFASVLLSHRPHLALESNCYLTPPGTAGLFPHADARDTVLVQQFGNKVWHVWNSPLSAREAEIDAVAGLGTKIGDELPSLEVTLTPGDVLYIPKACVHSSRTQDAYSLHVTFGLRRSAILSSGGLSSRVHENCFPGSRLLQIL